MPKFEQGQTVWSARLEFGRLKVGCAVVKSCGRAQVKLSGFHGGAPFGYRSNVPIGECFASELEALEWAASNAQRQEAAAEASLQHARELTQTVRDAITALVKP